MADKKATVTVKPGDSMSAIAAKAGVSLSAMKAANPQVANPSLIKPNQVLNLPAAKPAPEKTVAEAAPTFNNDPATIALQRLTSGQTLTPEQRTLLGMNNPTAPDPNKPDPNKPDPNKPSGKKEVSRVKNADGTFTVTYDDGTISIEGTPTGTGEKTWTATDGTVFTDQAAFVAYQNMLNNNARGDYNAAQAAAAKTAQDMADKRDAFALIQDTMKSFGFTDIEVAQLTAFAETQIMDVNIGPNQGILNMKALPVYQARFAGNQTRLKAGKNALSEADYLAQENAYGEYMKAYGVQSLGSRDQYATLIGNDVSATELNKRLNLAVDRVKNSDPEILKQLKTYYPSITDSDLVTYFLKPADALPDLEKKVATSEISAAAVGQGFAADMTGAAALQAFGVTREKALTGYQDLKTVLPVSERLSKIYGEAGIKYDRAAGEAEFLTNSADAAEKRRRLKALERGAFSAQTGVERGVSLGTSTQGQF
jgi:LysM repeat protein